MRRQFAGILVSRGLGSALQAVALVLLARNVQAEDFGFVNVVVALVGIVLVATGLGMSIYVPLARARGDQDEVAAAIRLNTRSNLLSAVVLVAGVAIWAGWRGAGLGAALIGLSLALERNIDTLLGVPVADGNASVSAVSMLLRRIVSLAVLVPALLLGLDPVWSYGAGLLAGALAGQLHVRRVVAGLPRPDGRVPTGALLRRAAPFLVSNLTGQARTLDVSIVAAVLNPAAAGLYAAAAKLVQPLLLVPQALGAVITPRSARLDPAAARRLGARLSFAFLACLLPGVPLMVWAEPLVVLVMGQGYAGAGPALAWSLAALPFIALASSLGAILQGQGRQRLVATNGVVFAVLMMVGILVGALSAGIAGAAAGLGASYALRAAVLGWALLRVPPARPDAEGRTDPSG